MRFWNRATSEATGVQKQKTVRASLKNNQVSTNLRVFGQRAPFSDPMNPNSYERTSESSMGTEVLRPDTVPVDLTGGNVNDVLLRATQSGAAAAGVNHSTVFVTSTPTNAEITAAFGTPASVGAGFIGTIDRSGAHTVIYICISDGASNWHFVKNISMQKAV